MTSHGPKIVFVLLIILTSAGATGAETFDKKAYVPTTLAEIYAQAPKITEGVDLFFKKRQLIVTLKEAPATCANGWINVVYQTLGIESPPATNHCLTVADDSGIVNEMYVQDALVDALRDEVKTGAKFRAFVVYCFYNGHTKKPGFVLGEFEALDEPAR